MPREESSWDTRLKALPGMLWVCRWKTVKQKGRLLSCKGKSHSITKAKAPKALCNSATAVSAKWTFHYKENKEKKTSKKPHNTTFLCFSKEQDRNHLRSPLEMTLWDTEKKKKWSDINFTRPWLKTSTPWDYLWCAQTLKEISPYPKWQHPSVPPNSKGRKSDKKVNSEQSRLPLTDGN